MTMVNQNTRCLIKTSGEVIPLEKTSSIRILCNLIDADFIDTVQLPSGWVMLVDDDGIDKDLPVNDAATVIYHSVCRPGTTAQIHGDVVITVDEDFGS